MKLNEVEELHARYLIGFWRKSYFARSLSLMEDHGDPPIIRELENILFWCGNRNDLDANIHRLTHAEGLRDLIANTQGMVEKIVADVEKGKYGDNPQLALQEAQKHLETVEHAKELLTVITND